MLLSETVMKAMIEQPDIYYWINRRLLNWKSSFGFGNIALLEISNSQGFIRINNYQYH